MNVARNASFEDLTCGFWRKSGKECSFWRLGRVAFGGSLVRSVRCGDLSCEFCRKLCTKHLSYDSWRLVAVGVELVLLTFGWDL